LFKLLRSEVELRHRRINCVSSRHNPPTIVRPRREDDRSSDRRHFRFRLENLT